MVYGYHANCETTFRYSWLRISLALHNFLLDKTSGFRTLAPFASCYFFHSISSSFSSS